MPAVRIGAAGALYFVLVFGTGFVLGIVRTLWIVPLTGARTAELIEMPFMFVAILLAASWITRRFAVPPVRAVRWQIGLVALSITLAAEFAVGYWMRGLSIREDIASRDPLAGATYLMMLGAFAAMPAFVR